jgi:hypothetical protein
MIDGRSGYRRVALSAALVAFAATASCSGDVTASEARRKADEYVRTEFNVADTRLWNVETTEKRASWVVTYSAKGEALGGPLIVGVDKKTRRAHLIEGYQ